MTKDQQLLSDLRNLVDKLPDEQYVEVELLALRLRQLVAKAGEPVGPVALALVMAETQAK